MTIQAKKVRKFTARDLIRIITSHIIDEEKDIFF